MEFIRNASPYSGISSVQKEFPSLLPWNEATDWVEGTDDKSVLLGVDGTGKPMRIDVAGNHPHVLVSAPTGRGKSSLGRSFAVQRLARGDVAVFLDIKRHSHRWAQQLAPNVHYAKSAQDIGNALVNVGREVHRRNLIVDDWSGPLEDAPVGPDLLVVFEEMNATMRALRELDKRLPPGSYTAQQGLEDVSFMGRGVRIRLLSFAQMATYRASGGAEIVENYDTRILVGHSQQAWRWLAGDCGRFIPAPEEEGRGIVCRGGRARECQFLWLPEEDAAQTVLSSVAAQRRARELSRSRRHLPAVWRTAIGR